MLQLREVPKPIGIFTKDDIAAATVINACQHLGFSVPDDVAVAGPNNDELLHCKVRYFTDGLVVGSREFVDDYYSAARNAGLLPTRKRDSGARKMRVEIGSICTLFVNFLL